ncbi:histidyl-tRNA synthetase domain protein [Mycobacterium xenopi 4042]|uniref:Histidyl-tRNA synthetase domain protein n=1 Tax=Mycobacterium xenopi 4042 TaxID=1299334 RepID=X8AP92_MYCXE|nr:histidyl-tRNA synthetase domain protein [Mycobacterium xenopi 4042]
MFGVPLSEQAKLRLAVLAAQLRRVVCGWIWPTATAASRARCARRTVPARASRWSPATAISKPAPSR